MITQRRTPISRNFDRRIETPIHKTTQRPPPNILHRTAPAIVVECSRFTDPEPFVKTYTNYLQFHEENPQNTRKTQARKAKLKTQDNQSTKPIESTEPTEPTQSTSQISVPPSKANASPRTGKQEISSASSTSSPDSDFLKIGEVLFDENDLFPSFQRQTQSNAGE